MESLEETCNGASEPKVGILLDLGSPFNATVEANTDGHQSSETTACETTPNPDDGLDRRHEPHGREEQSTAGTASPTVRTSQPVRTSPGCNWADVADENLIDNEEFDFDLPVSPQEIVHKVEEDEEEDEDEVFFGPVGFTESCVAKKTQLSSQSPVECKPLSPLNAEQYVEIFLEANKVALELAGESQKTRGGSQDPEEHKDAETVGHAVDEPHRSGGDRQVSDSQAEGSDLLASLPGKPEARTFKRLVRKEMRSPRRGTYTISISPANTPQPPHLPSADECVSKLCGSQPKTMQFSATGHREQPAPKARQRESKLPVRGSRKSMLPTKSATKRISPLPPPPAGTSTDKLLRKKMNSPPKRKRLNSCESEDRISEADSSVASESSEPVSLSVGIASGKRLQPGSLHTKAASDLKSVGNRTTPRTGATLNKSSNKTTKTNAEAASSMRAPAAKASLLQQGPLQRRTLQASRPLKPLRPGQQASQQLTSKPQPLKAVAGAVKVTNGSARTTPKTVSSREAVSLKPGTPSTPVHLDKKAAPKRLLTSKPTPRSLSSSSVSTPRSKMIPPSTPTFSDSKLAPAKVGSARRRSGIPTPSRRLNSASSIASNPSPMRFRGQRSSTTTSTPAMSPCLQKPGPRPTLEGAIKLDLDSSPTCTDEVTATAGRTALETRTNVPTVEKCSPVVIGLLIDLNPDITNEKIPKASPMTQGNARDNKENLIDLL